MQTLLLYNATEVQGIPMKALNFSVIAMAAGLLVAAPAFAQSTNGQKQRTQDGGTPTVVGPASKASKQRTDGDSPTVVGPASGAYKQRTDGDSPTVVGPASGAYKQRTQSLSHSDPGPLKQN
jgi:hypothetical protein